ncbi:MAG: zinc-ribbon domain-containing protein [Alphaproteobacteria bacterium]|nr:zinc-ribbon domain-containing protein [Alphaproteobacteria bacterium]
MIIRCPSCNTRYDLPASRLDADSTVMKCSVCNHSWLEGRTIEVPYEHVKNALEVVEPRFEADAEIQRLVEATRGAEEAFASKRRQRRKTAVSWSAFVIAITMPFAGALAFPDATVRVLPAAMAAYDWAGWDINVYGLNIRKVETQHLNADGTPVIAIKGEIANTTASVRKIPWLRFSLQDAAGAEVYSWQLDTNARPLQPGESTSFVTRIASPPAEAGEVKIRFARIEEIGSSAHP